MRSETKLLATDAPLSKLPAHEREALAQLRAQTQSDVERAASTLPQEDVWRDLGDSQNATLRDEILLRFLRYNALSTDNAQRQVRSVLEWRAEHGIAAESPQVMYGVDAGIPVTRLSGPTPDGDLLFFCAAEMYSRCDVDHAKQGVALARLFDLLLYDVDGPRAKRGSVVIDFTNMSARNVDLVGLRLGVLLYTSYYPDLFLKILFFNYPKFIYGGTSFSPLCTFFMIVSFFVLMTYFSVCYLHAVVQCGRRFVRC